MTMGERVHVRTVPAEPVGGPESGATVDYAKPDVNPKFPTFNKAWFGLRAAMLEMYESLEPAMERAWHRVGGTRQVVFACGLAFIFGGVGAALSPRDGGPAFAMAIGGLLVGIAIRLRSLMKL
jgi:hypothetical protein